MNNQLSTKTTNTLALSNTAEAKKLLPILEEYSALYKGEIKNIEVKKKNLLLFANELSRLQINGMPAIEAASEHSIRDVALRVITEDIDLSKKQAVIIPYGNNITLQKEFYGNVAIAKQQYGNKIDFRSQIVYPKDIFEIKKNALGFGIDSYEHQTKPANMITKNENGYTITAKPDFVYTYVVDTENDKVICSQCFSYQRCYDAWTQAGIKQTHKKFPAEMMIKTIENYVATRLYNKSNSNEEILDISTDEDSEVVVDTPSDFTEVESFTEVETKVEPTVEPKVEPKVVKKVKKVEEPKAPEIVVEEAPEPTFLAELENIEKEPEPQVVYESKGVSVQDLGVENYEEDYLPDFLQDEPIEEEKTQIRVSYMEWKTNYSKTGEWELVPQTYDQATKSTEIRKK